MENQLLWTENIGGCQGHQGHWLNPEKGPHCPGAGGWTEKEKLSEETKENWAECMREGEEGEGSSSHRPSSGKERRGQQSRLGHDLETKNLERTAALSSKEALDDIARNISTAWLGQNPSRSELKVTARGERGGEVKDPGSLCRVTIELVLMQRRGRR